MKHPLKNKLILLSILLLLGVIASADLVYVHINATSDNWCNVSEKVNCSVVALSRWATIFGIPIAYYGLLAYLSGLVLAIFRLCPYRDKLKSAWAIHFWASSSSVAYSIFLAYVSIRYIGAVCIMCIVLHIINLLYWLMSILTIEGKFTDHISLILSDIRGSFSSLRNSIVSLTLIIIAGLTVFGGTFLERKRDSEIFFLPAKVKVSPEGFMIGNQNAKNYFVVFSDFECPFCNRLEKFFQEAILKYDNWKIYYRDFPLDKSCNPILKREMHQNACMASLRAYCAESFNMGLAYREEISKRFHELSEDTFKNIDVLLGINSEKMLSCIASDQTKKHLKDDIDLGVTLEIRGTPSILYQGQEFLSGAIGNEKLLNQFMRERN